jgi:hypothetical protein
MAVKARDFFDSTEEPVIREVIPKPYNPDEIDPARLAMYYDRQSDTLLIHFHGRGRYSISVPIADYLYVMVNPYTEIVVGIHIEGFLAQAVRDVPEAIGLLDYAELRGITLAEVRALQSDVREGKAGTPRQRLAVHAPDIQERRMRVIASFIGAEKSRRDLPFLPAIQ